MAVAAAAASFLTAGGQPLVEEYDPGRPNDYAKIREARDVARKEVRCPSPAYRDNARAEEYSKGHCH